MTLKLGPRVIFIDSNVPMYLVGAPHPNRNSARDRLDEFLDARTRMVTDAEVFQEVLHRYRAIRRMEFVASAFRVLEELVDETFSIGKEDVRAAAGVAHSYPSLSARDSLHVAVMQRTGVRRILSFDRDYDIVANITRVC